MAKMIPFRAIRPRIDLAENIAALPYDVYSQQEAKREVMKHPFSFLRVDRAETLFTEDIDMYSDAVYQKAHDTLWNMIREGELLQEEEESYYIYELTMKERVQTGVVACASIDDYLNRVIKKHENTRADKELDRIKHVETCDAQTGPIFLTYKAKIEVDQIVAKEKEKSPLYCFVAEDDVKHVVWRIEETENIQLLGKYLSNISEFYIADGHHRCASAVKVGMKKRKENPRHTGAEPYNYFLSVLFPDNQLMIMDYNRVIKDLNGYEISEFIRLVEEKFVVECKGNEAYRPDQKGTMGMCIRGTWYRITTKIPFVSANPTDKLDVSILQREILEPILGILDPKTDKRIDFVGGIRGVEELEKRTKTDSFVAFAMYPTCIAELIEVADADLLMPPKSTWFEPKLRSGLFIHSIANS